jgi:methylated-DNA-[protein]-cysteine S-methyltransferase
MRKHQLNASYVYDILCKIPEGKVSTYGDIAKALGRPGASRAIGQILNKNPDPFVIPCHRVIMSTGQLGGYAFGKEVKKELLEKEGLRFDAADTVRNFARYRIELTSTHQ